MMQEKLSIIFDDAHTAILVFNPQQEIIFSNAAALRLFGYADMVHMYLPDLFDAHTLFQPFFNRVESKKLMHANVDLLGNHSNGQKLPVHLSLKKISGPTHNLHYIALIDIDRTFRQAHVQKEFPLSLCIEIQTSLDTVISATQWLLQSDPRPEQTVYLELLASSGKNIKKNLEGMLHRGKNLPPEEVDFDFRKTIENIRKPYKGLAKEKEILLRLLIEEDIPEKLKGSPAYLSHLLDYLLGNLFRFIQKGRVFMQIYLHQEKQRHYILLFKISCIHTKITDEQARQIIESVKNMIQDHDANTGDLPVTHPVEELPATSIVLEAPADDTLVFHVYFSCTKPKQANNPSRVEEQPAPAAKRRILPGLKVLYVDDVTPNQLLMEGFCHHWNVSMDAAFNGEEALRKIQHNDYDLVLMDLYMPGMDGFETAYRIRNSPQQKKAVIPIFAISASVSEDVRYRAAQVGMNDFIPKPIDPDFLFEKLAMFVK